METVRRFLPLPHLRPRLRIGRRVAPAVGFHGAREVSMVDEQRITRVRVGVPSERQQHNRAKVHRPAPEFRQAIVLHTEILDLRRVVRPLNLRDLLVHRNPDLAAMARIDVQLDRLAIQVSWLGGPALPLTAIHRHFDRVPIGAMKCLIPIDQRLNPVVARRNVLEAADWPTQHSVIDDGVLIRLQSVDIETEDRTRAVGAILVRLQARLSLCHVGNE